MEGLKVCGPLSFSLTGVLARISSTLAAAGIPIFAVSTYDTDYFFVRKQQIDSAAAALVREGWTIRQ